MKRRFNYTGRKKIEKDRFSIITKKQNGSIDSFYLDKLDLDGMDLPGNARIYVEAYYRTERKHFDFGTIAGRTSGECGLTDMAYREDLKFRILVVDPSHGRILALADGISPEKSPGRKSILPVEFKDTGNEIWRIEYEGEEGAPILCINNKIPDIQNIAKHDPQFFTYVYPAVVKEILTRILFVEDASITNPSAEWHADWLSFARTLGVETPEDMSPADDKERSLEWIMAVVEAFINKYAYKFQEYTRRLEEIS